MKTIALALCLCTGLPAQTPVVQFEVASLRAVTPSAADGAAVTAGVRIDGAQFHASLPLRGFVALAWRARPYQLEALEWMAWQWYEITASLPEGHSKTDEVREMLQALLAERFHMKTHRQARDVPVYALTVMKGGDPGEGRPARSGRTVCGDGDIRFGNEHCVPAAARGDADDWRKQD
jgi:Protein of unknown function (DUF3738)